jgi:hypothetical protein
MTLGVTGIASAAGAGDQTGKHGDMSGHGGPVDKEAAAKGDRSRAGQTNNAPEPAGYKQSGGSSSGQGGGGNSGSSSGSGSGGGTGSTGSSGQSGGGGY